MLGTVSSAAIYAVLLAQATPARANESVGSPSIVVEIRSDNAAIDTATSFGFDNFNPGTPVSDWGLMINGDNATFRLNTTGSNTTPAITQIPFGSLTNTGQSISGTGTFGIGSHNLTITREYTLVTETGYAVKTTITNNGAAIGEIRLFDTYDPDIGFSRISNYVTHNDVFTQSGLLIGRASDLDPPAGGYTVDLGVSDPRAVVASGFPFQIDDASSLLSVATSPFDGNNANADMGLHIVFTDGLGAGASSSFIYLMGFGTSPSGGLAALLAMNPGCVVSIGNDSCEINATSNQLIPVDALAGSDILRLTGASNFSFDVSKLGTTYTGFEVFEKTGTSAVTLTGMNSFAGPTILSGGSLILTGGNALSDSSNVIVGPTGTLALQSSETIGALTGAGTLNLGAGTVLATGGNNASSDFSGTSTGAGGLRKEGSGTLALTGANAFGGTLEVAGGRLVVADGGTIANASLSTAPGTVALLGAEIAGIDGSGMTGSNLSLAFAGGSTVYLDDNTVILGSSMALSPGANLAAFFTTNTDVHAQIVVASTANIAGGHFGAYLDPLSFSNTDQTDFLYTDVIKAGSVAGAFASADIVQAPNDLFSIQPIYRPNAVDIRVSRGAFSSVGGDGANADHVGGALENVFRSGTSDADLQNLFVVIANSSGTTIDAIYKAITGPSQAETKGAAADTDLSFEDSINDRTNMARSTGCTVAGETWCFRKYAQAASPVISDVQGDPGAFDWLETGLRDAGTTSVWGRIVGGLTQTDGDANGPGSNQMISGLVIGADHVVNTRLLLGLATQVTHTRINFRSSSSDSAVTSVQLGGYFSYGGAQAYLNGNISVSGSQSDTKRLFNIGPQNYRIESSSNSWFYASNLEIGKIFELSGFRVEPNSAISATFSQGERYTETGGGGLNLIIDPDASTSLRSLMGVRLSRVVPLSDRKIVPQLRVSWRHEWLDRRQEFTAAFAGAPTASFRVQGQSFSRDSLGIGTGLTVPLLGIMTGYFDAEGSLSRDTRSALVSFGTRATW